MVPIRRVDTREVGQHACGDGRHARGFGLTHPPEQSTRPRLGRHARGGSTHAEWVDSRATRVDTPARRVDTPANGSTRAGWVDVHVARVDARAIRSTPQVPTPYWRSALVPVVHYSASRSTTFKSSTAAPWQQHPPWSSSRPPTREAPPARSTNGQARRAEPPVAASALRGPA
jgi:hypothetical protein